MVGVGDGSGYELGVVWDYNVDARRFTIRFPPCAECDDIGMSWEELRGEALCHSSATERALLDESPNNPPMIFTPQPRVWSPCRPRDAVWDPRKAAWVDCTLSARRTPATQIH